MLECIVNLCLLWAHDYHQLLQSLGDGACGRITWLNENRRIVSVKMYEVYMYMYLRENLRLRRRYYNLSISITRYKNRYES